MCGRITEETNIESMRFGVKRTRNGDGDIEKLCVAVGRENVGHQSTIESAEKEAVASKGRTGGRSTYRLITSNQWYRRKGAKHKSPICLQYAEWLVAVCVRDDQFDEFNG